MDRRKFMKSVTGAATVAAASAAATKPSLSMTRLSDVQAPPRVPGQRVLRVGVVGASGSQGLADFMQQFAARVRAATDHALSLEVVGSIDDGAGAIARDQVDCYCATEHAHLDLAPELAFFAGLPGKTGLTPDALHIWLTSAGGQQHWDAITREFDIKPLAIAHTGPISHIWSKAPIERVEDLLGQSIYAEGLARDVARGLGAEPFDGHLQDLEQAAANGTVFAAEVGGLPLALAAGLPQQLGFASTSGLNSFGSLVTFAMNTSLWERLPAGQRMLLETAAVATYHETRSFMQTQDTLMIEASRQRFKTQYLTMPNDVTAAIARISDTVVAHLAASSPRAVRINASYMSFRKTATLAS